MIVHAFLAIILFCFITTQPPVLQTACATEAANTSSLKKRNSEYTIHPTVLLPVCDILAYCRYLHPAWKKRTPVQVIYLPQINNVSMSVAYTSASYN